MIKSIKSLFTSKKPLENVSGVYLGGNRYLRVVRQPSGRPEFGQKKREKILPFFSSKEPFYIMLRISSGSPLNNEPCGAA